MPYITARCRFSSRTNPTPNPDRRHCADFARAAVFAEFGHHGWALDQADFEDRKPWRVPVSSPDARFAK